MAVGCTAQDLKNYRNMIKHTNKYLVESMTKDGNDRKYLLRKICRGRAITARLTSTTEKNLQKKEKNSYFQHWWEVQ